MDDSALLEYVSKAWRLGLDYAMLFATSCPVTDLEGWSYQDDVRMVQIYEDKRPDK